MFASRGLGLWTIILLVSGVFGGRWAMTQFVPASMMSTAIGYGTGGILAGLAIWQLDRLDRSRRGHPASAGDEASTRSASLFFIPIQYWAYVAAALGLAGALSAALLGVDIFAGPLKIGVYTPG